MFPLPAHYRRRLIHPVLRRSIATQPRRQFDRNKDTLGRFQKEVRNRRKFDNGDA